MTSQVTHALPFTKFTQGGFGFASKSRSTTKTAENDEDWYIPYNGPYEAPREPPNRRKPRDSWGDLVEAEDEEDTVLNDRELHLRYGGGYNSNDGGRQLEEERKTGERDRSFSVTSGRTISSGTVDPSRPSIGTTRQSTVSSGTRPAMPSYVSMDAVGKVGESPIPPRQSTPERNRTGLAAIFNFSGQPRKPSSPIPASAERGISSSFIRKPSLLQRSNTRDSEQVSSKKGPSAQSSSSPEFHTNPRLKDKHQQLHQVPDKVGSEATEVDYYNSYYSTLLHERRSEPALNQHRRHHHSPSVSEDLPHSQQPPFDQFSLNRQNSSTSSGHPYALAVPRTNAEGSSSSPPLLVPPSNPPRLTFTPSSSSPSPHNFPFTKKRNSKLRNSSSTPDLRKPAVLRDAPVIPQIDIVRQRTATPHSSFTKAKDRWLSAETWCDALLFPRPRLAMSTLGGSGRIVSPPDSPIGPDLVDSTGIGQPSIPSRVLAHSRSLVDLKRPVGLSSSYTYPQASTPVSHEQDPQSSRAGAQSRSPQSATFTQDDLALPIVPSLAHVLEQGQQLADERKAWQLQAQGSLGNKHTRNLSRARSKSLTQKGRRKGHQPQTSMEYLAAKACLGHQNLTPILPTAEPKIFPNTSNASSSRKGSHSHNSSLAKTLSKSSKSHSRNDSRGGDSWSKSAVKVAKSTGAICGLSASDDEVTVLRQGDTRATSLEGALKGDGTKTIRLADPAHIPVDRGHLVNKSSNNSIRLTPSPSVNSDERVGIALGTPPLVDDYNDTPYHPSHPYAQGGLSFSIPSSVPNQARSDRGAEYAGPHPSINSGVDISQISDTVARHRLPPHLLLHPYAQGSARDSYFEQHGLLAQHRSGNDTPNQMKMWAQLSPGVVREVLPGDFQYSPFMSQKDNLSPVSALSSDLDINDTIGVGETLANAARFGRNDRTNGSNIHAFAAKPVLRVDSNKQLQVNPSGFGPRTLRPEHTLAPSEDPEAVQKPSLAYQVVSASPEQQPTLPLPLPDRAYSTSPASSSSSPHPIHRLGSYHGLESFQDLFYKPNNNLSEAAFPDTPCPPNISTSWDHTIQRHRTESGLTSLARQLSQEFELVALERKRSSSQFSSVLSSTRQQSSHISMRPMDGSLQFVFEEGSQSELVSEHDRPVTAFHPSDTVPEDVESSRASSLLERNEVEEEDTTMLRVGVVESISTPASVAPQHRPNSYSGETSQSTNDDRRQQDQLASPRTPNISGEARERTFSGLQPPSSDAARSSFMTTSTTSRMSGLSDFPAPPKDHHMSLSAYFNESLGRNELPPDLPPPPEQQVFFGRDQDAGDLVKTLSSSS